MTVLMDAPPVPHPIARRAGAPRVALYSHDALGLGHIRRNLAIAHALSASDMCPDILLLTSAAGAVSGNHPERCDIVALPAMAKGADGTYGARHLTLAHDHLFSLRESILLAALDEFRPDVLIVDKHARGLGGELEPALDLLAARGTRIVLGVRDVLDDAETTRTEWNADRTSEVLRRWYSDVWVYGDRKLHDPLAGLHLPDRILVDVAYTGYLANGRAVDVPAASGAPYVLAMVGGGADGVDVAHSFALADIPQGHRGILVTGPQMPASARQMIERIVDGRDDMVVATYVEDAAALIAGAAAIIGMGGYNTVCEALAARTPMLVVPRVHPRREQMVRAEAMRDRGLVDVLDPAAMTPAAMGDWLDGNVTGSCLPACTDAIDLDGLTRVLALFESLIPARRGEEQIHAC
ncbi:glycosyltransferase family protein [Microbacterium sp. G2-8]|uniref:glycosyltransferase family protein n=1 Tax=Microbacterium sp. G2-8 TaxID=2842454 RepID=UPI001C8925BC|nr:glycosyltransferase [Microbacterium sp. G2-8]